MVTEHLSGLGRVVEKDLRDLDYLLSAVDPPPSLGGLSVRSVRVPIDVVREQGQSAASVACALSVALEVMGPRIDPGSLHSAAVSERHPLDMLDPISLRRGCKVLLRRGLIDQYLWTYDVPEIASYLLNSGLPIVVATDWYDWMYRPDPESGILARPHGTAARLVGGASYIISGIDLDEDVAEVQLSLGHDWGGWIEDNSRRHGGQARLPLDELRRLLKGNGEAVVLRT